MNDEHIQTTPKMLNNKDIKKKRLTNVEYTEQREREKTNSNKVKFSFMNKGRNKKTIAMKEGVKKEK